jgi:hypothetical protein
MARVLITLQGKGGVGKSYLTSAAAQWLIAREQSVICVDTDTLNPTLLQYKPLNAEHIQLSVDHVVDPRAIDRLIAIIHGAGDGYVVVDVGSNGFETVMAYQIENNLFDMLADMGHEIVVQTVIAGGADTEETLKGATALLASTEVPMVLWLNEHLGPLEYKGAAIADLKFIKDAKARLLGMVVMRARTRQTFGRDVEDMLRQRITFDDAIKTFDLMPAHRIKKVRDDLFEQMDAFADALGLIRSAA